MGQKVHLVNPRALHQRALSRTREDLVKESTLFQEIQRVLDKHPGVNCLELILCGKHTREFASFTIPENLPMGEAELIAEFLLEQEYYAELRTFNPDFPETKSLVVCWDPEVIQLSKSVPRLNP